MIEQRVVSEAQEIEGTTEYLRRGFRGSVAVMACRVVSGIAAFAFSIYTVRYLPMEEYAVLKILRSFAAIGMLITSLGITGSLLRFVPELVVQGANAALRRLLLGAAALKVPAVLVMASFLVAAYGPLEKLLGLPEAMRPVLPLVVAYLIAVLLQDFLSQGILAAFLDQAFYSVVMGLMVGGYTVATVWCLLNGYGIKGVLWSQVVFLSLGLAALIFRTAKRVAPVVRGSPGTSLAIRSRVTRFTGFSFLLAMGANLRNAALDVLVISSFLGDDDVAVYGFASGLALMAAQYTPIANIGNILTPLVAREYSRTKDPEKLVFFFGLATKLAVHTSIPILVGLWVFLPNVITDVYGNEDYLAGIGVAELFLGYMAVKFLTRAFAVLYSVLERLDLSLYSLFLMAANVVLLFVLVPRYGIMGAAWSTCGTAPIYFLYHWVIFRRILKLPLRLPWGALLKTTLNLVPPVLVGLWLRGKCHSFILVGVGLATFEIVYLGCAKLNRIFDQRERALLARTMGRWVRLV